MSRSIEVVNGYEIVLKSKSISGIYDMEVRFLISGEFFTCSKFTDVYWDTIEEIVDMLDDWTQYNETVEHQCEAVSLTTMIYLINEAVLSSRT